MTTPDHLSLYHTRMRLYRLSDFSFIWWAHFPPLLEPSLQVCSRHPHPPPPAPSPDSGSSPSFLPLLTDFQSHYPSRIRRPLPRHACNTNHHISQHLSYDSLSDLYRAYLGQLNSISIPWSVVEALQNSKWVEVMKVEMNALDRNDTR